MAKLLPEYPAWGILIVRVVTGLLFAVHGWQKFAGGIGGVAGFFGKVGIPMPGVMAPFIAALELIGGVLLIIGLGTRWISLLFACEMLVTTFYVQLPTKGWSGADLDRLLLAVALLLVLAGPGAASVDSLLATRRPGAPLVRA
jgi:putative oxidoreductase